MFFINKARTPKSYKHEFIEPWPHGGSAANCRHNADILSLVNKNNGRKKKRENALSRGEIQNPVIILCVSVSMSDPFLHYMSFDLLIQNDSL